MTLKRMAEFKRDDYSYESPDGDKWEITLIQTADRKYVEIKKEETEEKVQWDIEMLLDIADAVRAAIQKPAKRKPHQLQSPNIIDHRDKEGSPSPSDKIQASVEESMQNIDPSTTVAPVQSFSPEQDLAANLVERKHMQRGVPDPEKVIRRA